MSDENNNQNGNGDTPRPRRGRPAQPRTDTRNEIEARIVQLMEEAANTPEVVPRTIEEIIEYNKTLMTKIQNILMEDLKTISTRNVARVQTPNGINKIELLGLPATTRDYLMKLYENCNKALTIADAVQKDDKIDPDKKLQVLADKLYRGIPGLKLHKN